MRRIILAGLAAVGLACAPARAAELRDEATGLAVTAPEGYEATKAEADPRYAVVFEIRKPEDDDTGCKAAFQPAPQNASLTQDEINAFGAKKEWTDLVKATLSLVYDVQTVTPFEQAGVHGAQVTADFKPVDDQPRAAEVRSYLVLLDTPKGRTTIVCIGDKASFDSRRRDFEAIARSISPPR